MCCVCVFGCVWDQERFCCMNSICRSTAAHAKVGIGLAGWSVRLLDALHFWDDYLVMRLFVRKTSIGLLSACSTCESPIVSLLSSIVAPTPGFVDRDLIAICLVYAYRRTEERMSHKVRCDYCQSKHRSLSMQTYMDHAPMMPFVERNSK
jgi:hypothetical protein